MTQLQAVRWFAKMVARNNVVIARQRLNNNWGMDMSTCQTIPRLSIPKIFNENDDKDKLFRKNFVNRCKLAKGFSNTTLAILHEIGHWETRSAFDILSYDRYASHVSSMEEYMENPYERLATEWAICWLQNPLNRSIAKEFERRFFGFK